MEKPFMSVKDIAEDLSISEGEAEKLVRELHRGMKAAGKYVIAGYVPAVWYERQKESGFMAAGQQKEQMPLTERRLLSTKEFCVYSGLGRDAAYRFGEREGIIKRNGRRVLFDRVLFDEWCSANRTAEL